MASTSRFIAVSGAAIALVLSVSACGVAAPQESTPTVAETSSPTADPTRPAESPAVILGVAGLSVNPRVGLIPPDATVTRDQPDAVIALLTGLFGEPTMESTPFGDDYRWDGVSANVRGWAVIRFETASLAGYQLRTSEGVAVGASRAEVLSLAHVDDGYDGDGDGQPDAIGLEPVEEPGTESLLMPGAVGTSYVDALFDGDTVSALVAPSGDWQDV